MSVPTGSVSFTPRVVRPADVDWVKFDAQLARNGSVDPVDKALYAALASFVDKDERDSDPDPTGDVPTRAVLAACIGRSVDTVDRATKRLEKRGLLRVERRRDPHSSHANLPSVYELLDHELWDERAAARAEARKTARRKRQEQPEQPPPAAPDEPGEGGRTDAGGGPHGCGGGGRMGAAGGGRMGAAVPLSPKKISLSEARARQVSADVPAPREGSERAPQEGERETAARDKQARSVAAAWTSGTGLPRVPGSERKIREQAAELLDEGHDSAHLASVARWMAAKGWRDLGYALTAPDAPAAPSAASEGRPQRREWCGACSDETRRHREDDEGRPYRCPDCHPLALTLTT